jgi:broad-specificity NMP kinase
MTPGEAKSTICHKLKNNNYNINNENDFMCSQFDKSKKNLTVDMICAEQEP